MAQSQEERLKAALAMMDDAYWDDIAAQTGAFGQQSRQLLESIADTYSALLVVQVDILETKGNGYKLLISAEESARPEIIRSNKERLDLLTAKKQQTLDELADLMASIGAMIAETAKLGLERRVTP